MNIGQLIAMNCKLPETKIAVPEIKEERIPTSTEDGLSKANKVKRLKKLCEENRRIGFVVETPGTTHGRPVHAVMIVNAKVEKTSAGDYIIIGRDVELELTKKAEQGELGKNAVITLSGSTGSEVFRSYRIDRIFNGSITYW
jgi:hypothetical protein